MRNIDCQRNSILVFLPVYGCTDSGVHHYADRPIERIQEKPHILNKPHNIILMRRLGQLRMLFLLQQVLDILLRSADV